MGYFSIFKYMHSKIKQLFRTRILFPSLFIIILVLTIQYSHAQSIIQFKEPGNIEIPNLSNPPPATEDENDEEIDDNGPTIKDDDQETLVEEETSKTEGMEKEPSTTFLNETRLNETKDSISIPKMLNVVEDPREKLTLLSGILEEQGKISPKTTDSLNSLLEGNKNKILELCKMLSKDKSINISDVPCTASPDESDNGVVADIVEYNLVIAMIIIVLDLLPDEETSPEVVNEVCQSYELGCKSVETTGSFPLK